MGTLISKVIVSLSILVLTGATFNLSSIKDCEVTQVYRWVQKQRILWMFKNPDINVIGKKTVMPSDSGHDIIGYDARFGYYSGQFIYSTNVLEYSEGDTVVLAHEIAHAFGADEDTAEKIHQKFEQEFEMKECN